MNQFGAASEGKLTEKKGVAETFISGHGSPFVAQVSLANAAQFYKALVDALDYRGTSFIQSYTSCQPEHGIADDVSTQQAGLVRDARSMPQFVFNPSQGEMYSEAMSLAGNPNPDRDWYQKVSKKTGRKYAYTVAHYATTEARFRRHFRPAKDLEGTVPLQQILNVVSQNDVVGRTVFDQEHFTFVPDFGVTIEAEDDEGNVKTLLLSRMMVLFCVERRRSWRMLQSRAGITNVDYEAQKKVRSELDAGEYGPVDARAFAADRMREELAAAGIDTD